MLHGVELGDDQIVYRDRYVLTRGLLAERAEGKALWPGVLELPRFDLPHGLLLKNTANTALVWHDRRMLALWEGGAPHAIRLPELATVGLQTFDDRLRSAFCAHPKVDPETGEMLFFGYSPVARPYLTYGVVSAAGELVHSEAIDLPRGVLIHDFAITARHTVLLDMPVAFSLGRLLAGEPALKFDPEGTSRVGILPRRGDNASVRWFEIPRCVVYHVANAWEEGGVLTLLGCRMASTAFFVPGAGAASPGADDVAYLHRWRFDLGSGRVEEESLGHRPIELPTIDNRRAGRAVRYVYAATIPEVPGFVDAEGDLERPCFDGIVKYDLATGEETTFAYGARRFGGEPVFAPRPGGTGEDDGWLLTFVHDEGADRSELVVLDARQVASGPVARLLLPRRVPYGFHGIWVTADQIAAQRRQPGAGIPVSQPSGRADFGHALRRPAGCDVAGRAGGPPGRCHLVRATSPFAPVDHPPHRP